MILLFFFSLIKQKLLWLLYERGDLDRWDLVCSRLSLYVLPVLVLQLIKHSFSALHTRYPMAMGTLADLEDQDPIPGKENPLKIHLKVSLQNALD